MQPTEFVDRRGTERRRSVARCSHRIARNGVANKCVTPALWRCTGCGQLNCERHRVQLDDPSICNHCRSTMLRFTSRRGSRRNEPPRIITRNYAG